MTDQPHIGFPSLMKVTLFRMSEMTSKRNKPKSGQIARIRRRLKKLNSPKISVRTLVKKNGSQERQLKAEVVVGTIITSKRITNNFDFMFVQRLQGHCLDRCFLIALRW